jgi:hypothetical protein
MKKNGITKNGVNEYGNKYELLGVTIGNVVCDNCACCSLYCIFPHN